MDLFARMLNGETPIRSEVTHLYTMLLQGGAVGSHMHMPMAPATFTAEDPVTAPWELISRGKQVGRSGSGARSGSGGSTDAETDSTHLPAMFQVAWEDNRGSGATGTMPEILKQMGLEATILAAAAAAPATASRP